MIMRARQCSDFYCDPHTKHYTGVKKIFKGWCSGINFSDKIVNMDFIHTVDGCPVYMSHSDNFHDFRERFFDLIESFRKVTGIGSDPKITIVIDRAIYKLELFQKIMKEDKSLYFVTWEKGYKRDLWDESLEIGQLVLYRCRNSDRDIRLYNFRYIDRRWKREEEIRQIIVRATNPGGNTIEVSVISNDLNRNAQQLIRLMFNRWIQENDFKYPDSHFGINEITSYGATHYKNLQDSVKDKQIKSGAFKALTANRGKLNRELSSLLLKKHQSKRTNKKRDQRIEELTSELRKLKDEMENIVKEESRLQVAVDEDFYRLDMLQKYMMDSIKILARNLFYVMLAPFKKLYNNYRDDHVVFRNLTRSHGCIRLGKDFVDVILFPTAHYQPKLRETVKEVLEQINASQPVMPDNSGRILRFSLGEKKKKLFAIVQ